MPYTRTYLAEVEHDEDHRYVVTIPDFEWGATDGATRDEPLTKVRHLLPKLVATTMQVWKELPKASNARLRLLPHTWNIS